ncbi:MAG: aminopeptidase P family protein [Bacteroidetes bacterium]|nr:MAG: aminopeptidase P family protein [Bacteroidota bacterium]
MKRRSKKVKYDPDHFGESAKFKLSLALFYLKGMNKINILLLFAIAAYLNEVQASSLLNLGAEFHKGRREELRSRLKDSSAALVFSYPERNRSADINYEYHANPDLYYLTGFTEPNSVLVLMKNDLIFNGIRTNEILFIRGSNPEKEMWDGKRLSLKDAPELLKINAIALTQNFEKIETAFLGINKVCITGIPKGLIDKKSDPADLSNLLSKFMILVDSKSLHLDSYQLGKLIRQMREVKTEEEIKIIQKAVNITMEGHKEMARFIKPGISEFQVEAAGEYVFKYLGAEDVAYPSICGTGQNSVILHYHTNRDQSKPQDLILLDMGAQYKGYAADITRTFPVSGKFSAEQKLIYNIVLEAQLSAIHQCKPGKAFMEPHREAQKIIQKGLADLGILQQGEDPSKYFPHGTSHYLGLDVHDPGSYGRLEKGMIITIEPGIYIPYGSQCDPKWWSIGIRIEDDVLITETGHQVLSGPLPKDIEAIEKLMEEKPVYLVDK